MPVSVRVAAYLEFGLAALGSLLLATTILFFDWNADVADAVGPFEHRGVHVEVTSAGAIATAITGLALYSAIILLSTLFAVGLLRGANWARICLTVLFGLGAIAHVTSPPDPISVVSGLVELVAVILLWLPTSNRFFRSVKEDRVMRRWRPLA